MSKPHKWYNLFVTTDDAHAAEPVLPTADTDRPPASAGQGREVSLPDFPAPLKKASESGVTFPALYEAAGILPPKHGFTILKVSDMLQSEHLQNMTPEVKRNAILVALEAAEVKVDEIVQDAMKRRRALDTYAKVEERAVQE